MQKILPKKTPKISTIIILPPKNDKNMLRNDNDIIKNDNSVSCKLLKYNDIYFSPSYS